MNSAIPPLVPDLVHLTGRALHRGVSVEDEIRAWTAEQIGGHRTGDQAKLDARRVKAQAELARIESEEGQQEALAASWNRRVLDIQRGRAALKVAGDKLELHRQSAANSKANAAEHLSQTFEPWALAGDLLLGHLNQVRIVEALEPLVAELAAALTVKEAEAEAFKQEHGIVTA